MKRNGNCGTIKGGKAFKTGLITVKFKGKSLASLRFQIQRGVTTEDISDSENNPARRSIHSLSVPFNLDYFLFTGNTVISRGWARGLDQLALEISLAHLEIITVRGETSLPSFASTSLSSSLKRQIKGFLPVSRGRETSLIIPPSADGTDAER